MSARGEEPSEKRAEKPAGAAASGLGGTGAALSAPGGWGGRRETGLARSLPWGAGWASPARQAGEGAKAQSRGVQRDARRYDGGFFLY